MKPLNDQSLSQEFFNLSNYDCFGFDLDNTLIRYNVAELLHLQYGLLSRFLIEEKGYSSKYLHDTIGNDHGIICKGLVLDILKGNVLQIESDGRILQSSHGTSFLTDDQIVEIYGPDRKFELVQDLFSRSFKGLLPSHLRLLVDIYDIPAALVFARAVDSIDNSINIEDNKDTSSTKYFQIWQDIISAFYHMYEHKHVRLNKGGYYSAIMQYPEKYLKKSSQKLLNWLDEIKSKKCKIFLLTGSPADFANFIANYVFGLEWKEYFDILIVNAKKPGFFLENRPFLKVHDFIETDKKVLDEELGSEQFFSQGNWTDLKKWLNIERCVYFGDNLLQDVRGPSLIGIDSIAVVEELEDNKIIQPDTENTTFWRKRSFMSTGLLYPTLIQTFSELCIPSIDVLANLPLDTNIECFTIENNRNGYFPKSPNE